MPIVYKDCAEVEIPAHICDDCSPAEGGGIRSIALIKKDFAFTDITDPEEWTAGIEDGSIIVVPSTRGTFDGGSPVTGTGYGDNKQTINGYDFTLVAHDPAYAANGEFWNKVRKRKDFKVAWRTETQVHVSAETVTVNPTNPVEEGLDSAVDWLVNFTWFAPELSIPFDATNLKDEVFRCFEVTPAGNP
jgi:hypothetical protein